MKRTIKNMKIDYSCNSPKTFGIVYKDSAEVVEWRGQKMYFRSKDTASKFCVDISPAFFDSDLEVVQFEPTAEERRNRLLIADLAKDLSKRRKSVPKRAKKSKFKHSEWLEHLENNYVKHKEELKSKKLRELKYYKREKVEEENYF